MSHPDAPSDLSWPTRVPAKRMHGGPDALGVARFDFSTNSNACGPCPGALAAVQQADATRYPDPRYAALRSQLADFHGVALGRVLLAGSASECIFRISAWVAQREARTGGTACVPRHAYGDYAQAAQAWGLGVTELATHADLVWCCEPSSPLGGVHGAWPDGVCTGHVDLVTTAQVVVLDCAYAPLRLSGTPSLHGEQLDQVWQMFSPNKALGLTGVRAAYAIAPLGGEAMVQALDALAPSWPLGAHGVALLQAWVQPDVQGWLTESLHTLRRWKTMQIEMLTLQGWTCLPSDANFFCVQPAWLQGATTDVQAQWSADLEQLRAAGIKLRDTASFGLPGHARLSVQPPVAQDALRQALQSAVGENGRPTTATRDSV